MPIDYKKYPEQWLETIRPRIMKRADGLCEATGCDFKHNELVWSVKYRGRVTGWYRNYNEAMEQPRTIECRKNRQTGQSEIVPNPKQVKVLITIAHLDHDECNHAVSDDRLMAMCQLCHLRYDAKEKYRRSLSKSDMK